ncbi:phage shock protein operon transcriptional activator [Sandarakinorhabdus cyanobacteriorum]|uniref:Phage shock protein operon transcriptional activator n=1 Tax=Sandarakinorhabdus cyanobacteriorum TaxID=1981098 RepID=A0A255YN69_9SPHN|nr:phage shock protein operon transcriptional activator [Sandarakinorhabdus cyanobacteriorum]OYQ30661.1 phage shock protein operon transcriptional activator [Sandarakinorhabdus cyanobacteriorum]
MAAPAQMIGSSFSFLDAVEQASAAAALNRPVLVIGERGTGKELIADRLHRLSPRWSQPLVSLNCAALPENLIDAELFGYEPGAFTGAQRARAGRFEDADGGTLFLDEIGTLSSQAQERLLRVVEYGELSRLGSNKTVKVDVRLVGATNEDLPALVMRGRFRADLLDRLSFEVITLPPLRERAEDIELLATHFARRMAAELGWPRFPGFSPRVLEQLQSWHWPGNVRELKNVVERALYRWGDAERPVGQLVVDPFESPWRPAPMPGSGGAAVAAPAPVAAPAAAAPATPPVEAVNDLRGAVMAYEKQLLEAALERNRHNQRRTAAALGLSYDQLRHALKRHGLMGE